MATYYAQEQVGVADGTVTPALRADGRRVGGKVSAITATKVAGQAWAAADKIYLGRLRAGDNLRRIFAFTDTSFATATISIGTLAAATKYVNAATLTTTNTPVSLSVLASALDDGPLTADEDIYATIGTAGVAGGVIAGFDLEFLATK